MHAYNVLHLMVQKALPIGGYVSAGLYRGAKDVLFTNSDGTVARTGAMIGWFSPDVDVKGLKMDVNTPLAKLHK